MTNDIILEKTFEPERWQYAIGRSIDKDIRKDQLYQLTKPETRISLYQLIKSGQYRITPPHIASIPKDTPGEFRTVYINEPIDRILLSIVNDLFFELCPEMVHPRCKSYQKGIGCGKVVKEVSDRICNTKGETIGWKSDLSKYFDTVPLKYIDSIFDTIEQKHGKSAIVDIVRDYYHSDWYLDENGAVCTKYQSLKQGCAVASFLADAILYDVDKKLSSFKGFYVRYSDDMLYVGEDYKEAMACLTRELADMELTLNPKKVEYLTHKRWFKFLGFSIKGEMISLSGTRIKSFQKEIEHRTTKNRKTSYKRALNSVNRFLYKGNGEYSWATQILTVCNVKKDIDTLNTFVMDCLRAVQTNHRKTGGLGYVNNLSDCCIARGKGKNVKANRERTETTLEGYLTIGCMRNALLTTRAVYNTLVASL